MTENPEPEARQAIITSHGAFHSPECRRLKRLKTRPTYAYLIPTDRDERWGWIWNDESVWPAQCCEKRYRVKEVRAWDWS